MQQRL